MIDATWNQIASVPLSSLFLSNRSTRLSYSLCKVAMGQSNL